jgi:hypothetical protein
MAHVALRCVAGHHFRMPADGLPAEGLPAPRSRPRTRLRPGPLTLTVQLCIRCRENPAGFWVSRKNGNVVRRPWCLSCCQELDRGRCDVTPFAR